MTLDIRKYLTNLIEKEAKISHFQIDVQAGKTVELKPNIATAIKSEFGDIFLDDADYIIFFMNKDGWGKDNIKKAFELTDRALGKDANKLSQSDFKLLPAASAAKSNDDVEENPDDEEPENTETSTEPSKTVFIKVTIK